MKAAAKSPNPIVLVLSGVIDEMGGIHMLPSLGLHDRPDTLTKDWDSPYRARLHWGKERTLERVVLVSEVRACGLRKQAGLEYTGFIVSLPYVKGAHRVELLHGDKVVFDRDLQPGPMVADLSARVSDGRLTATWELSESVLGCALYLDFDDGSSIPIGVTQEQTKFSVPLVGFPEGGKAVVKVIASDGILNMAAASKQIVIEPSAPLGLIIDPMDGYVSAVGQPLSLIGNSYDAFTRKVDWHQHRLHWRVNGDVLPDRSPRQILIDPQPGRKTIEIVSERWGVLASATVTVAKPSERFEHHKALLASVRTAINRRA